MKDPTVSMIAPMRDAAVEAMRHNIFLGLVVSDIETDDLESALNRIIEDRAVIVQLLGACRRALALTLAYARPSGAEGYRESNKLTVELQAVIGMTTAYMKKTE